MTSEGAEGSYFLSYSRTDEKFALRLAQDLRARGVAMWIDQLDIRPSEHWDRAIERAVMSCRGLVVILSPRSVVSDNVADEISYAIDSGKSVLPVKIEACTLPLRLTRKQVVDATGNYDRALQQCLDELLRGDGPPVVSKPVEPVSESLDPGAVKEIKQQLAPILGPIAARLVDKEAARSASIFELYNLLASHIDEDGERERFLARAPKGADAPVERRPEARPAESISQSALPAAEVETLAKLMARYIGPIASVVVKRESRTSASIKELRKHLAGMITDQHDRADFLRQSGG